MYMHVGVSVILVHVLCCPLLFYSVCSVHIGSVLLFMNDAYGNYIGVTVDRKLYYLNQSCVAALQDVAALGQWSESKPRTVVHGFQPKT